MPLSFPREVPLPTSSPLLTDTLALLLIQAGYFLLSRRFLQSALPTLRQISKAPDVGADEPLGMGAGEAQDGGRTDSLDLGRPELGPGGRVYVNASGGTSEPASPISRDYLALPGSSGRRAELLADSTYDSDDSDTPSYAGSPAPGTPVEEQPMPLLPLYGAGSANGHGRRLSQAGAESELGKRLGEVAGASASAGKRRVLRVFNGRAQRERERRKSDLKGGVRVTTTRGLGWLAT